MNTTDYTTMRLRIALREADAWTLKANKALAKLDRATDPVDIAHWQFEVEAATIQVDRWCNYMLQMEAEDATTT